MLSKVSTVIATAILFTSCSSDTAPTPTGLPGTTSPVGSPGYIPPISSSPTPPSSTGEGGPASVTTYHNDLGRTGQNLNETILTRANVNSNTFGKIASLPVDGTIYGQPLYMPSIFSGGTTTDVVFVATEHDSVYAFDANSLSTTPLWKRSFLGDSFGACPNPPCTTASTYDVGAPNVSPEIGITSTPVIDPKAGTLYVVAMTKENGLFYQRLHALNLATGAERPGSPVEIDGDYPGFGQGSLSDGLIYFQAIHHLQRAGLVLSNGLIYIAFSSFNDQEPTHGWVFAFNASSLEPVSAFMTTPNQGEGNIWMSGGAPAVDAAGNLYFTTSNGDPNYTFTSGDYENAVVKLSFGLQGFQLQDYFIPYNHVTLDQGDVDVGSGAVTLLPDQPGNFPHLAVTGGKEGTIYLLNRDNMGGLNTASNATSDSQIPQELVHALPSTGSDGSGIYGTFAYYQNEIFIVGSGDSLRGIPLSNGLMDWSKVQTSPIKNEVRGGVPSISANGSSDGIVWYLDASGYTYSWNGSGPAVALTNTPAVLYAFNTDDLSAPLYASNSAPADAAGAPTKFAVPTIAGGKVFAGTQTELSVYGLKSQATASANNHSVSGSRSIAAINSLHSKKPHPLRYHGYFSKQTQNSCVLPTETFYERAYAPWCR